MHSSVIRSLLLAGVLSSCAFAGTVGAEPSNALGNVVLQPADAEGNSVSGPGYFQVTASPGSTSQLDALVGNVGKKPISVTLAPVDARSGVYGGISYNLPEQRRKVVGSWLTLPESRIRVHPGKAALLPFTLRVPAGTAPGQYVGGLTAYVVAKPTSGSNGGRGSALIIQLRRVVAVVVTVPGPVFGRFTIRGVRLKSKPDAVYLIASIKNTGTILLKGQGHLWVWQHGKRKPVIDTSLPLETTVPRSTVHYPIFFRKHPSAGTYTFTMAVSWSGGVTRQKGNFNWGH